ATLFPNLRGRSTESRAPATEGILLSNNAASHSSYCVCAECRVDWRDTEEDRLVKLTDDTPQPPHHVLCLCALCRQWVQDNFGDQFNPNYTKPLTERILHANRSNRLTWSAAFTNMSYYCWSCVPSKLLSTAIAVYSDPKIPGSAFMCTMCNKDLNHSE
ncbi:hypothetical protein LCGC14_3153560, partial [marine sediment metagenome]